MKTGMLLKMKFIPQIDPTLLPVRKKAVDYNQLA